MASMNPLRAGAFALALLLALLVGGSGGTAAAAEPSRYVVTFAPGESLLVAADAIGHAGGTISNWFEGLGIAIASSPDLGFAPAVRSASAVMGVDLEPAFRPDIEEDGTSGEESLAGPTAADDLFPSQWHIRRVGADAAWPVTAGSHRTVVAVIDAGIAPDHPDLAPNLVFATCFAVAPGCDPYPTPAVPGSHATRVAGVVAAAFGGGRAVGVGPGLGLASYKVYEPDGNIYADSIWNALLDASERAFQVVNLSLGGWTDVAHTRGEGSAFLTATNRVLEEVTRRGTLVVAAAGNDWLSYNGQIAGLLTLPPVVTVSATGIRPQPAFPQEGAFDVLAYYSTWGAQVDIAAPGGDCGPGTWTIKDGPGCVQEYRILLTAATINPACAATHTCPTGYARGTGTSFAAPAVAGAAALVRDVNPDLTPRQVKAILQRTAQPIGDRLFFGHGMLDVAAAVREAAR